MWIWFPFFIAAGQMPWEVSVKVKNGLMISQTGGSKNDGGKMVDVWTDFRFLQDGKTPSWAIAETDHWWVLHLKGTGQAKIPVMPSRHDMNLAVDASLEFLDRLWDRRVPKFIDSPDALMSLCVKAAIRQE